MTIVMLIFLVFAFISCLHSISQWNKSLFEVESRFPYPYFPFHKVAFYAFNFSKQVPADSHSNFRFRLYQGLHIKNLSNCCRHKYDR